MGIGTNTSNPTCYTEKSTANDVGDTGHWDGVDANTINSMFQLLVQSLPRSQTITPESDGSTTFVPTWQHHDPVGVAFMPKTKTACGILATGYAVTVRTSTGITVTHGTYSQDLTSDVVAMVHYLP